MRVKRKRKLEYSINMAKQWPLMPKKDQNQKNMSHLRHIANKIRNCRKRSASYMHKRFNRQVLKSNFNLRKLQIYSAQTIRKEEIQPN